MRTVLRLRISTVLCARRPTSKSTKTPNLSGFSVQYVVTGCIRVVILSPKLIARYSLSLKPSTIVPAVEPKQEEST